MNGIEKVIDELGLIILQKDIELESQREEITKLKQKIEMIECYIDALESYADAREGSKNDNNRKIERIL